MVVISLFPKGQFESPYMYVEALDLFSDTLTNFGSCTQCNWGPTLDNSSLAVLHFKTTHDMNWASTPDTFIPTGTAGLGFNSGTPNSLGTRKKEFRS